MIRVMKNIQSPHNPQRTDRAEILFRFKSLEDEKVYQVPFYVDVVYPHPTNHDTQCRDFNVLGNLVNGLKERVDYIQHIINSRRIDVYVFGFVEAETRVHRFNDWWIE